MKPKVLVAAPVTQWYDYCWKEFSDFLRNLTYDNFEVFLVDNSEETWFYEKVKNDGFNVIKNEHLHRIRDMVIRDHNMIRNKVLKEGFDYLLILDQDVIPPKDVIDRLIAANKDVAAGLYFGSHDINGSVKTMPFAWVFSKGEKDWHNTGYLVEEEMWPGKLLKVAFTGMGCILISRKVLEKIEFRYDVNMDAWDDRWLGYDVWDKGFEFWCDTGVKCKHMYKNREFDYHELKKQGRN